jgi:hypothetical protein
VPAAPTAGWNNDPLNPRACDITVLLCDEHNLLTSAGIGHIENMSMMAKSHRDVRV